MATTTSTSSRRWRSQGCRSRESEAARPTLKAGAMRADIRIKGRLPPSRAATEPVRGPPTDCESPLSETRILIAEDSSNLREILRLQLAAAGYKVIEAED